MTYASERCVQELLSASETSLGGGGDDDGWKVLTLENGVEISKRRSSSLHAFRSRWLLRSVSSEQFIAVANAIDAAKVGRRLSVQILAHLTVRTANTIVRQQWDPDLVEAKHIRDLTNNLSIIGLRFGDDASSPLLKKREFIVYERRESLDDGTSVVAVASLPKEIAAGLQPRNGDSIRGLLLQSGWVIEKLEDDSCMVTYVVQVPFSA